MVVYKDGLKRKAVDKVRKLKAEQRFVSWSGAAEEFGVTGTTLSSWFHNPKYNDDMVSKALPIEKQATGQRTKKLVAVKFACPHCGGPITLED